jgi:two-component system, probable response regulator PhcQ
MRGAAGGTVLIVDDEEVVRASLSRVLQNCGYAALTASDGEEALEILQSTPVEVIISDNHMPGLSGVDLLKIVRVRHPLVVRIMLTGDSNPDTPVRSINESEVYRFIRKPWVNSDLKTVISFAFQIARLEQEKRHLVTLLRRQLASPDDPADIEAELLRLAEDEIADT